MVADVELQVGDRVRRGAERGVIRSFVEPRPGWRRALVRWPDAEQHVDVGDLTFVSRKGGGVDRGPIVVDVASGETRPYGGHGHRKHGLSKTPEYRAWQTMRHRCTNPRSPAWEDYGGRGITMAAEWLDDPAAFIAHVGPRPSPKHEIDRIDNDRGYEPGYEPGNVRWATRSVNDRNRRSNRLITHGGETLPLVAWAERAGLQPDTLMDRLRRGWSIERALAEPVMRRGPVRGTKAAQTSLPTMEQVA